MRVVIAGAGNVGSYLASDLTERRHQVVVIEQLSELASRAKNQIPGATVIHGDACEPWVLERAEAARADVVVAATGDDEDNLVISLLAKQEFAVPRVIARVNHPKNQWLFNEAWGVRGIVLVDAGGGDSSGRLPCGREAHLRSPLAARHRAGRGDPRRSRDHPRAGDTARSRGRGARDRHERNRGHVPLDDHRRLADQRLSCGANSVTGFISCSRIGHGVKGTRGELNGQPTLRCGGVLVERQCTLEKQNLLGTVLTRRRS